MAKCNNDFFTLETSKFDKYIFKEATGQQKELLIDYLKSLVGKSGLINNHFYRDCTKQNKYIQEVVYTMDDITEFLKSDDIISLESLLIDGIMTLESLLINKALVDYSINLDDVTFIDIEKDQSNTLKLKINIQK